MKKISKLLVAAVMAGALLTACGTKNNADIEPSKQQETDNEANTPTENGELKKISVGATPAPHAEILEQAKDLLAEKGYELDIKEFVDYVQPNLALESNQLDANFFQHEPYLDSFNEERKTNLVSAGYIHYEPFAIYPAKTASLKELQDGAKIAVPNDATNEARALLLLESEGLITLKEDAGIHATKADIVENTRNFEIVEMEAAQLPRVLNSVDLAVINGNFALSAGLKVETDSLAVEDTESVGATTYRNVIAVKSGNESNPEIKALIEVLQSDSIREFIQTKYEGAVVPLF